MLDDFISDVICPVLYICRCRNGAWFITDAPSDVLDECNHIVWYGEYI